MSDYKLSNFSQVARKCFAETSPTADDMSRILRNVSSIMAKLGMRTNKLKQANQARMDRNTEEIVKDLAQKVKMVRDDNIISFVQLGMVVLQDMLADCVLEAVNRAEAAGLDLQDLNVQKAIIEEARNVWIDLSDKPGLATENHLKNLSKHGLGWRDH